MRRIVVVGCAGAGKTTLSRELALRLGVPHVERDELGELGGDEYRAAVAAVARDDAWVFDGAPYFVDDVLYPRAEAVVALDYPRRTVMRRVVWRSLRRPDARGAGATRITRCGGRGRCGPSGVARSHCSNDSPELASARLVRLGSPAAARRWLATV